MSRSLKLNVKNVILGCHNFNDILARNNYRFLSSLSPSALPRALPLGPTNCTYHKQDYVKNTTFGETVFPSKLDGTFLNRLCSETPITGKWLDEIQTGPVCVPDCGLPWKSTRSFYYDQQNPVCSPSGLRVQSDCEETSLKPTCLSPIPPDGFSKLDKSDPRAKGTLCTAKTVVLNGLRYYCASPCQPQHPKKKRSARLGPCGPRLAVNRPKPKCRPMLHTRPELYASKCRPTPPICQPKLKVGKKSSGRGKDPCAEGKREIKRNCYGSDKKGSRGGTKKGPVCPPSVRKC